jgi:predicted acyl esterase
MKKFNLIFFLFFFNIPVSISQLSPVVDSIPMRDGKKLAADIYIPAGMTQGPVVLVQTPYNRLFYRILGLPILIGMNIDSSDYIFVFVDWRGFYGSSGAAYAGSPDRGEDGYDCVEWIAQQAWSNQKIGTWGPSALGRVQYMTAKKNPPNLTCICPLVAGPQYEYTEYYPGGALRTEYVQQLDGLGYGTSTVIMAHTVHDIAWTIAESANFYPDSIQVPCFMIGGWYDHNIEQMLDFFNAIRTQSPANVRDKHRLLMGPWDHSGIGEINQGELSYNNAEKKSDSLALQFFDFHLRSISNSWDTGSFVKYFRMGDDIWNYSSAWPPAGITNTNYYFYQDSSLRDNIPLNLSGALQFMYDPTDPSPTIGGPTLRQDLEQGPYNQVDSVESRNDVLVFTTDPLIQDLTIEGKVTVHLKVSSDKTDTDFNVRLTDVYPDGRSILVNDGVRRMRFRNGYTAADTAAMIPGQIYDCSIELPTTAITLPAGHRLRVDISSSNYPRFNRNMNTGGPMYPGNSMDTLVNQVVATNTVYTNANQRSFITLPLKNVTTNVLEYKMDEKSFSVYPNPFYDKVEIVMNENSSYKIEIINTTGQLILKKEFYTRTPIAIENISDGLYFFRITDLRSNNIFNGKIIKRGSN